MSIFNLEALAETAALLRRWAVQPTGEKPAKFRMSQFVATEQERQFFFLDPPDLFKYFGTQEKKDTHFCNTAACAVGLAAICDLETANNSETWDDFINTKYVRPEYQHTQAHHFVFYVLFSGAIDSDPEYVAQRIDRFIKVEEKQDPEFSPFYFRGDPSTENNPVGFFPPDFEYPYVLADLDYSREDWDDWAHDSAINHAEELQHYL